MFIHSSLYHMSLKLTFSQFRSFIAYLVNDNQRNWIAKSQAGMPWLIFSLAHLYFYLSTFIYLFYQFPVTSINCQTTAARMRAVFRTLSGNYATIEHVLKQVLFISITTTISEKFQNYFLPSFEALWLWKMRL